MYKITYCPNCGHDRLMNRNLGEFKQCKTCGIKFLWEQLNHTRLKAEPARLLIAIKYLGHRACFTRLDMAKHLGMAKSPYLNNKLEQLVVDGRLTAFYSDHPQNGCSTIFYRRTT